MFHSRSATFVKALILLLIPAILACSSAPTHDNPQPVLKKLEPFADHQKYITAILPFQFKGEQAQYDQFSGKLIDLAIVELFRTERFRVVERGRIDAVLNEIKLSQLGVTDDTLANRVGSQLGAEMVLIGTMSSIKPIHKRKTIGIAWIETKGFEVSLQGRLINIVRGEIAAVGEGAGIEIQQMKMAAGAKTGSIAPDETLINLAIEKAVKVLVNNLAAKVRPKN